jgi:pimeloyl-ACP methyl ester carboxylesterase
MSNPTLAAASESASSPPVFSRRKVFVNGVLLHVVIGGSGPALLLIHGWLGSSYSWRKVMPLLARHFTVIAPDVRGYGDSAKPDAGYDGLTIKEDMRQLLQALGHRQAYVMGHDMGAPVALLHAAHHPEEVLGVGYFDEPLLGFNLERFTAFRADNPFVYWWFAFNATPHVAAMLWEGKEDRMVDYLLTAMVADPGSLSAADKAEYVRGLRSPGGLHGSFGWYRDSLRTAQQTVDAIGGRVLDVPLLALNGQFGHPGVREQFAGLVRTVEGSTLPGAGHLIAEEQPLAVAQEIIDFAQRHPGPRDRPAS